MFMKLFYAYRQTTRNKINVANSPHIDCRKFERDLATRMALSYITIYNPPVFAIV